jgi:hypothetical protein
MKCDTQHNDTQCKGTQYRELLCYVSFVLSVANKPIMFSVIMLNAVAPHKRSRPKWTDILPKNW